jgi:hypothetical protein
MVQSNLYKRGSAIAADVNVTDDDALDLGDVDVKSFPDNVQFDLENDSNRELGNTQVTNTVDTKPLPNGTGVDTFEAVINGTESLPDLSVPDSAELLLLADDENGSPILINGDLPLKAGDALPMPVDNANVISVETPSNQTIYGITVTGTA